MHKYFIIFLFIFSPIVTRASEKLAPKLLKYLEKESTYSLVSIDDIADGKKQKLVYKVAGYHKKSCTVALSRLSQYERYSEFLDIVKKSTYNEKTKFIYLHLSHGLMPFDMGLNFKLERINKPGVFKFSFDNGFLKDLKGTINVTEYKKRCLFNTVANWSGPHTKINSTLFAFFTRAVGIIAMKRLLKISELH